MSTALEVLFAPAEFAALSQRELSQTVCVVFDILRATARWIEKHQPARLLLVCSGTIDQAAYEDVLAAGALCDLIWPEFADGQVADSALIARQLFRVEQNDLLAAMQRARNGRRLL